MDNPERSRGKGEISLMESPEEIDLLPLGNAKMTGEPETIDRTRDITVAVGNGIDKVLHSNLTDTPGKFLVEPDG